MLSSVSLQFCSAIILTIIIVHHLFACVIMLFCILTVLSVFCLFNFSKHSKRVNSNGDIFSRKIPFSNYSSIILFVLFIPYLCPSCV